MSLENLFKSLLLKNKYSSLMRWMSVAFQILIFFVAVYFETSEIAYLSFITIVIFTVLSGELCGLFFAVVVGLSFSPLFFMSETGSVLWSIRALSFAFVALFAGEICQIIKAQWNSDSEKQYRDSFVEMPNRQALCKTLRKLFHAGEKGHFIIAAVSISNRKMLAETFGDHVTKSIFNQLQNRSEELSKTISMNIKAYSLNSDEMAFLFIGKEHSDSSPKENVEELFLTIVKKNFMHKGFFLHSDAHIGFYYFSDFEGVNSGEKPLLYAEEAMEIAERQMKDVVVYEPSNFKKKSGLANTPDILGEIDLAIRSRWMSLVYQPKIDLSTGGIHSVEALIRWNHPSKGFIPPDDFIPIAEHSNLIENITDFVLKQAILQLKLWQRSGIPVNVAINVSSRNLLQPDFVNKVLELLKEKELSEECLEIEITEGALINDFQYVLEGLNRFKKANIKTALDDFGTGYSSLQYLQKLPIDFLKIDRSFIRNLGSNKESKEIVKTIVNLAHSINLKTIAEGIETAEDYEYLNSINCDIGQGYYMSRPLTSNAFISWYSENNGVFTVY